MLIERSNAIHWEWMIYIEMFLGGIAAGAYLLAAILEVRGRGASPVARTAHLLAFPLMAVVGLLLIVDLSRPERFWHMNVMSKTLWPMFKWWSPMSVGSWAVLGLAGFSFVSFVDALVARRVLAIGPWRPGRTLHGTTLGLVWAVLGGGVALWVAGYSGVLLNVSNVPGWASSPFVGALYVATAGMTGVAAVVLLNAGRAAADPDVGALQRASVWLVGWWLLMLVLFVATLGQTGLPVYTRGTILLALVAAAVLGGLAPLAVQALKMPRRASTAAMVALLMLVGGFLVRYAVVMGPQVHA